MYQFPLLPPYFWYMLAHDSHVPITFVFIPFWYMLTKFTYYNHVPICKYYSSILVHANFPSPPHSSSSPSFPPSPSSLPPLFPSHYFPLPCTNFPCFFSYFGTCLPIYPPLPCTKYQQNSLKISTCLVYVKYLLYLCRKI